ncbi:hypothetical protein [Streptomyces luteocolor]|uniref:hypothetical protein n=1 Tax=Streptomyces luteocolor TaxID=285500 RepID=UPI0008530630|nr:hypothetical protein [Streptomyces luteocolor]
MSITQDLRTRRKHRGKSPWELVREVGRLEREADSAACQLVALTTEVEALKVQRDQWQADFDRAAIAYSGLLEDLREVNADRDADAAELAELRAFKANAEAVTVPPLERDTTAIEDQATGPIDVSELRAEYDAPVPLHQSPMAAVTDPGQAQAASWGVDDTQPIPKTAPPAA